MIERVTLSTLKGGSIEAKFQELLRQILENIRDVNTPVKDKRELTIKLVFAPTGDRTEILIGCHYGTKLANLHEDNSTFFIGQQKLADGNIELFATENNPRPLPGMSLFYEGRSSEEDEERKVM